MSIGLIALSLSSQTGGTCNVQPYDDYAADDDDVVCASILSTEPEPGPVDVQPESVSVTWDAPPVDGYVFVARGGESVEGEQTAEDEGRTVVFTPTVPFEAATLHEVLIGQECADDVTFEFETPTVE